MVVMATSFTVKVFIKEAVYTMSSMKDTYRAIFGEEYRKESYQMVGHSFHPNARIGKHVCSRCGLVALRNEFTDWSIKMGCNSNDHPSLESTRNRLTSLRR
jgi:hypothetical protein